MKTTKKGFTLIELIVVIAIIGVLAAILVPSMLGYIKKSKIQSANSAASSIYKAVNSACTELDEEDKYVDDIQFGKKKTDTTFSADDDADDSIVAAANFYAYVKPYFKDIEKTECEIACYENGCVAVAVKSGKYYGSYPSFLTAKNWDGYKKDKTVESTTKVLEKAASNAGYTVSSKKVSIKDDKSGEDK